MLANFNFQLFLVGRGAPGGCKEDRQAVVDSEPMEGEPGYESLIGFHGDLVAGPGAIFSWWFLILPLYAFSLRRDGRTGDEEE